MIYKDYQFLLVSILLLSILVALTSNISKKWFPAALIIFCIIDVSYWTKVNFFTVASPTKNEIWVSIKHAESNRNFKVDNNSSFKRIRWGYLDTRFDNFGMAYKYFTDTGYEPLILTYYDEFTRSKKSGIVTEDFRVLPVYEAKLLPDDKSVLSQINNGADLHKTALINKRDIKDSRLLKRLEELSLTENSDFSASIIHYDPNSIHYEIITEAPAVIFFNEVYYPGWRLFSGRKEVPLFKVNHAFRGTYLEAGSYRLKMVFSPFSFKIGLIISICCFAFIFYNIFIRRKRIQ